MNALQKRQTAIIKQLEQLRLKLNDMQTKLGGVGDIKSATANKTTAQKQQRAAPVAKPIDVSDHSSISYVKMNTEIKPHFSAYNFR